MRERIGKFLVAGGTLSFVVALAIAGLATFTKARTTQSGSRGITLQFGSFASPRVERYRNGALLSVLEAEHAGIHKKKLWGGIRLTWRRYIEFKKPRATFYGKDGALRMEVRSDRARARTTLNSITFRSRVFILGPNNTQISCGNVTWDIARDSLTSDDWFVLSDGQEFRWGKGFAMSADLTVRRMNVFSQSETSPPRLPRPR